MTTQLKSAFRPGQIVSTPAALEAMEQVHTTPTDLLARHLRMDAGDVCEEDRGCNLLSLSQQERQQFDGVTTNNEHAERIMSVYKFDDGIEIWVITEWDRSATTFLLPSEY